MSGVVTKLVALLTSATVSLSTSAVSFTPIGDLPGGNYESAVLAISKNGKYLTGYGTTSSGEQAMRWNECGIENIGSSLPNQSIGMDISGDGQIITGAQGDIETDNSRGFKWVNQGGASYLSDAGIYSQTAGFAISSDGEKITGWGLGSSSVDGLIWSTIPAWSSSNGPRKIDINYIYTLPLGISANGRFVVGGYTNQEDSSTVLYHDSLTNSYSSFPDLSGGANYSEAWDVSDAGSILVGLGTSASGTEAALWRKIDNSVQSLGDFPGGAHFSGARAVSSDGTIVVGAGTSNYGSQEAFIWDTSNGMRSIRKILLSHGVVDVQNWQLNIANDISSDGTRIVGTGINPNGQTEGWLVDLSIDQKTNFSGDFNGDNRTDIIWRNHENGKNWIHLYDGLNNVIASQSFPTMATNWSLVAITDFNNDGRDDLFWRDQKTGKNWLHFMDGTSTFAAMEIKQMAPRWILAGAGDLNGDGYADLIWRNTITGLNWLHLRRSSALIKSSKLNSMTLNWHLVAIGDFNADGRDDLIWRNKSTGLNWLQLMEGTRIATGRSFTKNATSWDIVGVGDFDGNGNDDLLLRNTKTGINWLNLLHADARLLSSSLLSRNTNQKWKVVQTGDFDGDTRTDLLWRNECTGQNWVHLLSGSSIKNAGPLTRITSTNWSVNGK